MCTTPSSLPLFQYILKPYCFLRTRLINAPGYYSGDFELKFVFKISSYGDNYLFFYNHIALKLGFTQLTIEYLQGLQRLFLKIDYKFSKKISSFV